MFLIDEHVDECSHLLRTRSACRCMLDKADCASVVSCLFCLTPLSKMSITVYQPAPVGNKLIQWKKRQLQFGWAKSCLVHRITTTAKSMFFFNWPPLFIGRNHRLLFIMCVCTNDANVSVTILRSLSKFCLPPKCPAFQQYLTQNSSLPLSEVVEALHRYVYLQTSDKCGFKLVPGNTDSYNRRGRYCCRLL